MYQAHSAAKIIPWGCLPISHKRLKFFCRNVHIYSSFLSRKKFDCFQQQQSYRVSTNSRPFNKKSAYLITSEVRKVTFQLINLWSTAIFDVFDRIIANRQTLAAYVSKASCYLSRHRLKPYKTY